MTAQLYSAIVRLRDLRGRVVGAGFLVGDRQVLTCAHVVARALGLPEDAAPPTDGEVTLDFPLLAHDQAVTARVSIWHVPGMDRVGDVAGLELTSDPPTGAQAVRLLVADELWRHEFRTFGFPAGYDDGVWASGRLLARQAMQWIQMEDVKETGYRVEPGFSGAPVWDDELDGVIGMTVASERRPNLRTGFLIPAGVLVEAWPILAVQTVPPCPYRGLLAFREQDTALFLGREETTARLLEKATYHPVVAVIGPSGSGKSSLVFAGLVPQLRRRPDWAITHLRPSMGADPFQALAAALLPMLEPGMSEAARLLELPTLAAVLRNGRLAEVADRMLEKAGARHLLLILDQFEELFITDFADRQGFIDAILAAAYRPRQQAEPVLRLVLTLRADFLSQVLAHARLAEALQDASFMLGPMTREQLGRAIEGPAAPQVAYEPGLVNRILDEVGEHPGNLPLLEFTLTLLWDRQTNGKLTHSAYGDLGGVSGALTQYAEESYLRLPESERDDARRILLQLVRPGEGTEHTRRVARHREMDERRWRLAQRLADTRLVMTSQDATGSPTVELVHETLISGWDRLRSWVEVDRAFRVWQERTRSTIALWEASAHDDGVLLRGAPLAEAERWLDERPDEMGPAERAFLQASRDLQDKELTQARRRNRRLRSLAGGLSLLLVVAVITASWAAVQTRSANTATRTARTQARVAESRELAQQAATILDKRPGLALLESLRAFRRASTVQARSSLLAAVAREPRIDAFLPAPSPVHNIAFGPGGRTLVINSGAMLDRWDAQSHQRLSQIRIPGAPPEGPCGTCSGYTVLGPRGRTLAWADKRGIQLWDVAENRQLQPLPGDINASVVFDREERIAVVNRWDRIDVWDLQRRKRVNTLSLAGSGYTIEALTLEPSGGILAAKGASGAIGLWNLGTHKRLGLLPGKTEPMVTLNGAIQFSPDGRFLAVSDPREGVIVWNVARRKIVGRLRGQESSSDPVAMAFSPDGRTLAVRGREPKDSIVVLLDTRSGRAKASLAGQSSRVSALAFSPDSRHLASGSYEDDSIVLWDLNRSASLGQTMVSVRRGVSTLILRAADRASLWTVGSDSVVSAIQVERATISKHSMRIDINLIETDLQPVGTILAFSPDLHTFATVKEIAGAPRVTLWDIDSKRAVGTFTLPLVNASPFLVITFSPDGSRLVVGGSDDNQNVVMSWDIKSRRPMVTKRKGLGSFEAIAFSSDGHAFATLDADGVTIWDAQHITPLQTFAASGGPSETYSLPQLPSPGPAVMQFSPNGQTLAINGGNNITLWDLTRHQQLGAPLVGHPALVTSLAFSPDGQTMASGDSKGNMILWDMPSRQPIGRPLQSNGGMITSLSFSPDGKVLGASASGSGPDSGEVLTSIISTWNIDPSSWAHEACLAVDPLIRWGTDASSPRLQSKDLCG